jgi:hypothetical protein
MAMPIYKLSAGGTGGYGVQGSIRSNEDLNKAPEDGARGNACDEPTSPQPSSVQAFANTFARWLLFLGRKQRQNSVLMG